MSGQAQQARELLGARLRQIRTDAGLTGRALAGAAGWQLSKVSKIEHGKQNPSEQDIIAWCRHCGARGQVPDLLTSLRHIESLWTEWKQALRRGTRQRQQRSVGLYEQARRIRVYEPSVVWGALQTPDYARALLEMGTDFYEVPDDDVEAGVDARMERRRFLHGGRRRFACLLGEQALYTRIGTPEVVRGQLEYLLEVMSLARLSLGVIPAAAPAGIWPGEGFVVFDEQAVMVETYSAELTITQPREIALYARAFERLQRAAVYGRAARELISRAADGTV